MKSKIKNKKITVDDLAGMISAGTRETKSFVGKEIEGLAGMISAGTRETKKFVGKEIEDLAGMVQRGFDETAKKVDVVNLGNNLRILSENNASEHEDIKLRLDNVAYRFELVELQRRVEVLEKKMQVKKN